MQGGFLFIGSIIIIVLIILTIIVEIIKKVRFKFYRKNVAIGTINGTLKYNETDNEIVKLLKENPEYTKEQMVEIIGKGSRTIQRSLNKLKENGRLVRIGSKKNGYWEIVE